MHILRGPCDLLVRRRELICWAGALLMVPTFHSFNPLVTRSQARKSSCTGKSSISPPDGRLKTDAMEWFPAYVDLHIAQARTALPLILLECTCVTSEFDFPRNNMPLTTPLWLECSRISSLVTSMNDLLTVWKSLVEEDTFLSKQRQNQVCTGIDQSLMLACIHPSLQRSR